MKARDILNNTDPHELRNIIHRLKKQQNAAQIPPLTIVVTENPSSYPAQTGDFVPISGHDPLSIFVTDEDGNVSLVDLIYLTEAGKLVLKYGAADTGGSIYFRNNTNTGVMARINVQSDNFLTFDNFDQDSGYRFYIITTDEDKPLLEWKEDPSNANVSQLNVQKGTDGGKINIGSDVVIWGGKDGVETVFNSFGLDIDHRIAGDTDPNLTKWDAGLDAVGIGGAAESGFKAKITGPVKLTNVIDFDELGADPATPSTGDWKLYFKGGGLYYIDDAGAVTGPLAAAAAWDGDITDIDETSSSEIGEVLTGTDQIIVYNLSSGTWVRSTVSRISTYVQNQINIVSSNYSPSLTNVANITASSLNQAMNYTRIGAMVTVSGSIQVQLDGGGNGQVRISLPVASDFTTSYDCNGTATTPGSANGLASVIADAANNEAVIVIPSAVGTSNLYWRILFMYEVL